MFNFNYASLEVLVVYAIQGGMHFFAGLALICIRNFRNTIYCTTLQAAHKAWAIPTSVALIPVVISRLNTHR